MSRNLDLAAALHRLHLACVEPLIIAARKQRRLQTFGIESPGNVTPGSIDLALHCPLCAAECTTLGTTESRYLRRYLSDRTRLPAMRGLPAMIDLDHYPNLATYQDSVRRHSKGGVLRQVRRARQQGFYCKIFAGDFHRRQLFAIDTSKRFRSGLVLASLLRKPPASDFPEGVTEAQISAYLGRPIGETGSHIVLPEPPPPVCSVHWHIDWGVFTQKDTDRSAGERLVGYILLRRSGNIVRTAGLMGHGAYLSQNVMKLLFHDVMAWLLSRADPSVQGVRYLLYGAIEHGNDGLAAWKRSFGFVPMALAWR